MVIVENVTLLASHCNQTNRVRAMKLGLLVIHCTTTFPARTIYYMTDHWPPGLSGHSLRVSMSETSLMTVVAGCDV